jgi:membrane protein
VTQGSGTAGSPRSLRRRVSEFMHRVEVEVETSQRRRVRLFLYLLRITAQVIRQWARDRCPQLAASLAFQTVLSIVPLLAVTLAALRAFGMVDEESSFVGFVTERFIPVSREELATRLQTLSEHVTFRSLGLVGLATTVALAFVMYLSLTRIMNVIWRVERRRSLAQTFVVFYASVTIGPLLLGVSLYQAARFGLTEGGSGFLFSLFTSYLGLFLANYFLPAIRVRVGPALIGAAVTAISFELAKYAFTLYVEHVALARFEGIYGALAVVPLSLVWIYWSWLMLLLGAEVAHAAQNLRLLEMADRRGTLSLENELLQRVNGPMAARIMVLAAERFIAGDKVVTRRQLSERFDLGDEVVERLVRRLIERDLLLEVDGDPPGLAPARPPSEITLAEVLAAFRLGDGPDARARSPVDRLLGELEREATERARQTTLAALARQPIATPPGTPAVVAPTAAAAPPAPREPEAG